MDKVVAFLEKYAEWVAVGVASLFLMYMVYANVVAPDHLVKKVGQSEVYPGQVDPEIQRGTVARLTQAMDAPAGDVVAKIKVAKYSDEFAKAMGPGRERMTPEYLAQTTSIRPPIPGTGPGVTPAAGTDIALAQVPKVPASTFAGSMTGNSLVAAPAPPAAEGAADGEQPAAVAPAVQDPAVALANALDKRWIMLEWKFPIKDLAAEWKQVLKDPRIPAAARETVFLDVEIEREEQVGPGQWGNKQVLQPLPLVKRPDWPKEKDAEAEEQYRAWAEVNQVNIVEPPFFQILKGDPWYVPSIGAPKDPSADAAVAEAANQPFDPANPPTNRKLTPQEQAQVYLYKKKLRDDEEKQKAAERKSRMGTGGAGRTTGGGSDRGGGRQMGGGGYAPLPEQLAAGPAMNENPAARRRPAGVSGDPTQNGGGGAARQSAPPAGTVPRDGSGGPNGRRRPITSGGSDDGGRPVRGGGTMVEGSGAIPVVGADGQVQNSLLTGPFDPTKVTPDAKGVVPDLPVWAYDDTAQPGKTYRYRMRVKLKNPIYHTFGLTAKDQAQLSQQFVIASPFSEWKEVSAPRNTEYFFAAKRQGIGSRVVSAVTVDVFKNEKGEWTKETFTVAPGDSIGLSKNGTDYATGNTVVDLRLDTREKDVQILVADGTGNMETRSLESDLNDPWYKTLQERVKNRPEAPAAGGGDGASPALINEIGTDRRR